MAVRLEQVRYVPSDTQKEAKWAAVKSKRAAMLRNTDWTQLKDVQKMMSPEVAVKWERWRQRVRNTKPGQYLTPEELDTALTKLSGQAPFNDVGPGTDEEAVSSEQQTIASIKIEGCETIMETADEVLRQIGHILGINAFTLSARLEEAIEFLSSAEMITGSDEREALKSYPFIRAVCQQTNNAPREVAENIINDNAMWVGYAATVDSIVAKCRDQILSSNSGENVRLLVTSGSSTLRKIAEELLSGY